jgi:hypothetical protein
MLEQKNKQLKEENERLREKEKEKHTENVRRYNTFSTTGRVRLTKGKRRTRIIYT